MFFLADSIFFYTITIIKRFLLRNFCSKLKRLRVHCVYFVTLTYFFFSCLRTSCTIFCTKFYLLHHCFCAPKNLLNTVYLPAIIMFLSVCLYLFWFIFCKYTALYQSISCLCFQKCTECYFPLIIQKTRMWFFAFKKTRVFPWRSF